MTCSAISDESKILLWKKHPLHAEEMDLRKDNELLQEYIQWNPIPSRSTKEICQLAERIQPAKFKNDGLYRIEGQFKNALGNAFNWGYPAKEKIQTPNLLGHYITLHTNHSHVFFKPTIQEVLTQLPEEVLRQELPMCFVTDPVYPDNRCAVGYGQRFHVAVTSVFIETQKQSGLKK